MGDWKPQPNSANLFFNDVGDNPNRPCWKTTGPVEFNGVEGYISGWEKKARNGNDYISLKFETVEEYESHRSSSSKKTAAVSEEKIPF
jgi:uncharacterized protein (DUF736 family)|tara:strand:+ start:368 stop:631 length:264 start_codon:yes stop_codon:yes gene_type:complete